MKINLPDQWTSEQLTLLQHAPRPVEIIKGAAGSGKTLTAIMKMLFTANYFASQNRTISVQVLSFNRTLRGYIQTIISSPLVSSNRGTLDLDVSTFATWATKMCELRSIKTASPMQYLNLTREGSELVQKYSLEFMAEEIEYILNRFPHDNLDAYLSTRRYGRGSSPVLNWSCPC